MSSGCNTEVNPPGMVSNFVLHLVNASFTLSVQCAEKVSIESKVSIKSKADLPATYGGPHFTYPFYHPTLVHPGLLLSTAINSFTFLRGLIVFPLKNDKRWQELTRGLEIRINRLD